MASSEKAPTYLCYPTLCERPYPPSLLVFNLDSILLRLHTKFLRKHGIPTDLGLGFLLLGSRKRSIGHSLSLFCVFRRSRSRNFTRGAIDLALCLCVGIIRSRIQIFVREYELTFDGFNEAVETHLRCLRLELDGFCKELEINLCFSLLLIVCDQLESV